MVRLYTNYGPITIELDHERAPKTADNFETYVRNGFYDGTLFHRVINGFMIQGGGFEPGMRQKTAEDPIENEARNGLRNAKYTVAMARTGDPHSAIVAVLHQRRRQRIPQSHGADAAGLGLLRVRQGDRGHSTSSTRSRCVRTGRHGCASGRA